MADADVKLSEAIDRASALYGVEADSLTKTQIKAGIMIVLIERESTVYSRIRSEV